MNIVVDAPCAASPLEAARAQKAIQKIMNAGLTLEDLELLATADKKNLNMALGALRVNRGFSKLSKLIG